MRDEGDGLQAVNPFTYAMSGSDLSFVEEQRPEALRSRTKRFALEVLTLVDQLPERRRFWNLANQIGKSSTSVGANYREAYRARSNAEFVSKMGESLKELDETGWWLELIDASLTDESELRSIVQSLQDETHQLIAIFTTIIKKVRSRSS